MTHRLLLFLLFTGITFQSISQRTDSLLSVLDTARNERKVKTLNELFRENIQSDPVKALGYTQEALSLATTIDDKKGMAASYNNLGVAYKNQGVLDKALQYYINSLKMYEALDNKEGIATTKNNIATIYSIQGDLDEARKNMEASYAIFEELGDQTKIIGSLNNLGTLYSDLEMYDKASELFEQAYALSDSLGKPTSDPLTNIGNVYLRKGNYQQAIQFYLQALSIQRKLNDRLGSLNTTTNIGIVYTKAQLPKQALPYLSQAEQMAKDLQAYSFLPSILKHRAENLYHLGDANQAYKTFVRYDSAREQMYGQESSRNIAKMEVALSLQEKEKEFEMLKKQTEIKSLELRNSRLFITLLILGVIVVLGGINFYFLGRKSKFLKRTS